VTALGRTARAIEQDVTARLKNGFLVNPQVTIEIEAYRSQVVYVTGQVRTPGAVPLTGVMSVMEALARAGSPLSDAGPYILINRRQTSSTPDGRLPPPEKVQMADLQNGRAQQIALRDGDTIFVPKAEAFFVTGYVKNPGPFVFDGDVTVAEAISRAGGVSERGSRSRLRITRIVDGKQVVMKNVKLEDTVQPGDSVEVLPRFF
jgi:polysaccharide export outer membrane protein